MDQCLACTRYEPIIGQIYEILDETGMNGSAILDDMQMSYMDLDEYKNLNKVENRSTKYKYADVSKTPKETPKSLIEEWKERDKNKYIETLKKTITDDSELKKKLEAIKEEDYLFIMDWEEKHLELQEPDVKPYPNEGIKAKYKVELGDAGDNDIDLKDNINDPSAEQDKNQEQLEEDVKFDIENYNKIMSGEWVDTREEADTIELNKYSSENYYFEDFNREILIGGSTTPGAAWSSEIRNKIIEMAEKIVKDCENGEAWYEMNPPRTTRYDKPVKRSTAGKSNQTIYDCSSFVSCCYHHAAVTSVVDKTNYYQYKAIRDGGGTLWKADEEGLAKLVPGDLLWKAKHVVSDPNNVNGSSHVMIYYGDGKIIHAANPRKGIVIQDMKGYVNSTYFVCGRAKELVEADKVSTTTFEADGEFNGTKAEFINLLVPGAQKGYTDNKIFPSVCMGQAILESGWGDSGLAKKAKNLFGIKAFNWSGAVYNASTKEEVNGSKITINASFRKYNSFSESIYDYGNFLKENPRYTKAGVFNAKTPEEQIAAIKKAGYATNSDYVSLVLGVIKSNNLKKYDNF